MARLGELNAHLWLVDEVEVQEDATQPKHTCGLDTCMFLISAQNMFSRIIYFITDID